MPTNAHSLILADIVKPLDEHHDPPVRWWDAGTQESATCPSSVETILRRLRLEHHLPQFQSEAITTEVLMDLTEKELEEELGMDEPDERRRLLQLIAELL
jgi:hypothetical protein